MKGVLFFGLSVLATGATPEGSPEDEIEGLWSYQSVTTAEQTEEGVTGLFLFHDGKFVHQAMRNGEPEATKMADAHVGTYQLNGVVLRFDVEIGVLVTPGTSPLLSGRSDTTHQVSARRSGNQLILTFANGNAEKLTRIPTNAATLVHLDRGILALTDEHFLLVTTPDGGWLAGSGTFERKKNDLRLDALRWFAVDGENVFYARDHRFKATFDGETLSLWQGPRFRVTK